MNLRRIIQLLNVRRTAELERKYLETIGHAASLADSAVRVSRAYAESALRMDRVLTVSVAEGVRQDLEAIQAMMASGQIRDAKTRLDSLLLVIGRTDVPA